MKGQKTPIWPKEGLTGKMKLNIVTLSDYNYLPKGLCLYDSLVETGSDFRLHYLCLDDTAFNKLKSLSLENVEVYSVNELTESDPILNGLKSSDYWFFCMVSASYFMNHLFKNGMAELTYADSDIYFHRSVNEMAELFEERQVAIFRHRQFPLERPRPEGWFNVGVVHFKNEKFGRKILEWWSDAVLNKKYPELSTCGDQKYLDRFSEMCPENLIYMDGEVGHGAPWQWQVSDLSPLDGEGYIMYNGEKQRYFFSHFSQFSADFKKDTYIPSTMHHIYTPLEDYEHNKPLKGIYQNYFEKLKKAKSKYDI